MEILLSVFLLSVVSLGIFALYNASRVFSLDADERIVLSHELQGALEHIYRYAMQGMGDEISAPGSRALDVPDGSTLNIRINNNDPLSRGNYEDIVTYSYSYSEADDALMFSDGVNPAESITQKVTVTAVGFALDGNVLTISLTGYYSDAGTAITLYSACCPRLASYN
jgi:hypothetical protein